MRLLIATKNTCKSAEFAQMLQPLGWRVEHLAGRDDVPTVEETGRSFIENASLKAAGYAKHLSTNDLGTGDLGTGDLGTGDLGIWALADDSGLVVDALGGEPGVDSAHFAQLHGAGQGDAANNALLLDRLKAVPCAQRTARFVCVLALANPQGQVVLTARGTVEGRIVSEARGQGGFGYDPLFEIPSLGKTTAELSPEEKHAVSHRGQALRKMVELMTQYAVGK